MTDVGPSEMLLIRPARREDETAIRACAEAAYDRYVAAIGRKPAPMLADFATQIAESQVHVALDGDNAVRGYIVFFAENGQMLLENVAVHPSAAGRGIGKNLIRFCEDEARRLGLHSISLYTNEKMTDNLSIYPHMGYVETDRRTQDGFNRVFFQKLL